MTIRHVAVLGLGIMGSGMAGRLLAAGFVVSVWNRSPEKAVPFAAIGAKVAATPAEAAQEADAVVAMLADDEASRDAWLGHDGALLAMHEGTIALDCGTLTLGWIRSLAEDASERGIDFIDAPVTGSREQAAAGTLRFLVGGTDKAVQRTALLFAAMGSEAIHLGPTGSGATLKLVNNFLCGVQVASLAEAIAMIERSGLDPVRAVSLLASGAPGSPLLSAVSKRMLDRAYDPHFLVPLMAKDLAYAEAAFAGQGISLPSAAAAKSRFDAAAEAGLGNRDIAAVVEPFRERKA